jgi:hypothetical protein
MGGSAVAGALSHGSSQQSGREQAGHRRAGRAPGPPARNAGQDRAVKGAGMAANAASSVLTVATHITRPRWRRWPHTSRVLGTDSDTDIMHPRWRWWPHTSCILGGDGGHTHHASPQRTRSASVWPKRSWSAASRSNSSATSRKAACSSESLPSEAISRRRAAETRSSSGVRRTMAHHTPCSPSTITISQIRDVD